MGGKEGGRREGGEEGREGRREGRWNVCCADWPLVLLAVVGAAGTMGSSLSGVRSVEVTPCIDLALCVLVAAATCGKEMWRWYVTVCPCWGVIMTLSSPHP